MRIKILIVDDDDNICQLLKLYLIKEGFSTIICHNGNDAAKYVKGKLTDCGSVITLAASDGVRYTVPHQINRDRMEEQLTVRFRVGSVLQNSYISVYFDRERVMHRKKQVMAPGEMEQVILQKQKLAAYPKLEHITIKIEKE